MDAAMREPVVIQKSGRNAVVMLAYEDYEDMLASIDAVWAKKALKAKKAGFIGSKKSAELLARLINADR